MLYGGDFYMVKTGTFLNKEKVGCFNKKRGIDERTSSIYRKSRQKWPQIPVFTLGNYGHFYALTLYNLLFVDLNAELLVIRLEYIDARR